MNDMYIDYFYKHELKALVNVVGGSVYFPAL